MGGSAFDLIMELVDALPHQAAVFVGGVPGDGRIPRTAITAENFGGERRVAEGSFTAGFAPCKLYLHSVPFLQLDDGRVAFLHIILRNLALVDLHLFLKEVHRIPLLQKCGTLVFFVGENAFHRSLMPNRLFRRRGDNQIRDCYLTLTDYLMNKVRSRNPEFKNDNFKDNLTEFLTMVLPGAQSETRRNVINTIAQKGWKMNSELVHKDSITIFDVLVSFNILQLLVSTLSNIIVGNNMPFNKIKCPRCKGEKHILQQTDDKADYLYVCKDCGCTFDVSLNDIIKKI